MQKEIEKINNFAQNDCRKCELRAGCFLAAADWEQAKKDYPCFYPVEGLKKEIVREAVKRDVEGAILTAELKTQLFYIALLTITNIVCLILRFTR